MSKLPVASAEEAAKFKTKAKGRDDGPTIAERLMMLAEARYTLHTDETGAAFAVDKTGPNIALPIAGGAGAMGALSLAFHELYGKAPSANALSEVKRILEAKALQEEATRVPIRVARSRSAIHVDMGDAKGREVFVGPDGWRINERAGGVFRRTACCMPLPDPTRGGNPKAMRKLFNIADDAWEFMVNWQVIAFVPDIPHVMPILEGAPGTAKTSATRLLVDIVDPSKGSLNAPPTNLQALDVAAGGSWAFALENISYLTPELSDGLARLITGTSTRERVLYTNNDVHVRELQRVVIMNGIHITGLRSDLLDRAVTIAVEGIGRSKRMTEDDLNARYEKAAPGHLGYLLDTLSAALKVEKERKHELTEFGRMADFERWLNYCDVVRGTNTLEWYNAHRKADAMELSLDDLMVIEIERRLSVAEGQTIELTAAQWLDAMQEPVGAAAKQWPNSPRQFTQRIQHHKGGLTAAGWKVEQRKRDGRNYWRLTLPTK